MQSANSPASAAQQSKDERLVIVALGSSEAPRPELLDAAYKDAEGVWRGYFSGSTVADLTKQYECKGVVQMMRMCDYNKRHDDALRTEPEEITERAYREAFEVLPPMKYHSLRGVESFRMTEFYSGTMTTIYATCSGRYWKFCDDAYMDAADLAAKVHKAMQANAAELSA